MSLELECSSFREYLLTVVVEVPYDPQVAVVQEEAELGLEVVEVLAA